MTRVLWVSGQAEGYGADRSLLAVVLELRRRSWDVTVTVPGRGPLTDDLAAADVPVVQVDPGVLRRVLTATEWVSLIARQMPAGARTIRRLARDHDLVHVNSSVVLGGLIGGH